MLTKVLKYFGILFGVVVLIAAAYVGFVFATFDRIEDNKVLEVDSGSKATLANVTENVEYSVITYNVGFGAYSPDYTFFMDGGSQSWGFSKDEVVQNINNAAELIKSYNPDFAMIEELDTDGTRSYHVNEYNQLREILDDYDSCYAMNYHSKFLMYPLKQPHGKNQSGLVLFSKYKIDSALRRSLPISSSFSKVVDLDRCYEIARIPTDNGRELVIYTVHLSAYNKDESVRLGQLEKLLGDISADYEKGNYIVCGGDFNHDLELVDAVDDDSIESWAHPLDRMDLGEHLQVVLDKYKGDDSVVWHTCRNADIPYDKDKSYTVTVDGFIVSDNIEVTYYEHINTGYKNSDHDPVYMKFRLKEAE